FLALARFDPFGDLDLALEELAGRPLRQLVDDPDHSRVLVGGDLALDVLPDLLGGGFGALVESDPGAHLLSKLRVGYADHGSLVNRRVLVDHLLDLARVDVVAAPDDQVLLAVADVEVPASFPPGH